MIILRDLVFIFFIFGGQFRIVGTMGMNTKRGSRGLY
jgi:hypothetical protein